MSKYVMVDVESDGPIQGVHSMVCFGAVIVEDGLKRTFYGKTRPISNEYQPDALAISGFSREEHEKFDDPKEVMEQFENWLKDNVKGKPIFISDNNGYDAAWINWYFHKFLGGNPFGWSSRRMSDLICGYENDMYFKWKHFKDTVHDHNPVNDAKGNAEVLLKFQKKGLKIKLN
jgi:hypothetical protein